jgi:hypothetical protein
MNTFSIYDAQNNNIDYVMVYDQAPQNFSPNATEKVNNKLLILQYDPVTKQFMPEDLITFNLQVNGRTDSFAKVYDYYWWNGEFVLITRNYFINDSGEKQLNPALMISTCDYEGLLLKKKNNNLGQFQERTITCTNTPFATGVM